jgi:hypothetical protein
MSKESFKLKFTPYQIIYSELFAPRYQLNQRFNLLKLTKLILPQLIDAYTSKDTTISL